MQRMCHKLAHRVLTKSHPGPRRPTLLESFFFCTVKTPKVAACSSGLCKAEDDDVSRLTMWEHDLEAVKEDVGAPFILGQKKGLILDDSAQAMGGQGTT